jgi:hypothetical protein
MKEICDLFIMCFVLFLFIACFGWSFNAIMVMEEEEEGGRAEKEEVPHFLSMTSLPVKRFQ